jgi:hypothetical protein
MILLAPHIAAFLQQCLPIERRASPNTCNSYAHAFRLLFEYAGVCLELPPSQLQLEQMDAPLIVNFLNHLETSRGNGAGSRNIRLRPSNLSCTTWNIAYRRRWSRSNGFWPSLRKRRTPGLSGTSLRAVAHAAIIAGPDEKNLWMATDTGTSLKLVAEQARSAACSQLPRPPRAPRPPAPT